MGDAGPGLHPAGRLVRAHASEMQMGRLSGRVLFPTTTQGPWLPIVTFRETTAQTPWEPDVHGHVSEEVVNYVLAGELVHENAQGERAPMATGAMSLEASTSEQRHDIFPANEQDSRWLSVAVRLPRHAPVRPASFRLLSSRPFSSAGGGALLRELLGPRASIPTASGLELAEAAFESPGAYRFPVRDGRRAVVYVYSGSGAVEGRPAGPGDGILTQDIDGIEVAGSPGLRLLLASVPKESE